MHDDGSLAFPHDPWPLPPSEAEESELVAQRRDDISIRGRTGPIAEFEDEFKAFLDDRVEHAITFNSGTSALQAAYFALGARRGTAVLGPALTYHAALSPAFSLGADVLLADIEPDSRCISFDSAERVIAEANCRVLTVVHQWGRPADMHRATEFAEKHGLKLLEDCSHAHGSKYRGRPVGTFGDAAVFSLQANKAVFAGEGGILVTNDETVVDRATLVGHYRDRSRSQVHDPQLREYWSTGFGLKTRMSPFNAIVAKHSLHAFANRMKWRHQWLERLNSTLARTRNFEALDIPSEIDMGAWYGFKPLIRREAYETVGRDRIVEMMRARYMDVSAPSGGVLLDQPLYSSKTHTWTQAPAVAQTPASELSAAYDIAARALSFPTFHRPTDGSLIDHYDRELRTVDTAIERLKNV
ncbi:DegT/DnrJ/EryC1/StrS family aminotransferase [Nocardiopsis kunsanensis]|uniref:Aminotransferase n=1 Tax=Nocardiopsis kunsanensis TaxID=141693 RepID=A0A918XDN5_9ACTN|nr:DegT/DnrJ/EryC1/StrS family aminotransferase [Nocardiopsis kunsanensis]GHD26415.1 hypothetical protein GCM10007147_24350 [Nocardiopsis kunsanensis]